MYNATSISYGGVTSESLGAIYCKVDNNSKEDIYVSDRDIKIDKSSRNWGSKSKNYLYKVQRNSRSFKIELGFEKLNDTIARDVSKIFCQDKFLPLIPNDTNRIYYCMPKSSTVNYIGTGGYISFDMISFDEYAYSGLVEITKDLTGNVTSTFNLTVFGDTSVYPTLIMTPISSGATLKIKNITNNNTFIEFKTDADGTQLIANEILTVDCENEIITTDQLAEYRYDNMSPEGDFLELLSGLNEIEVSGSMLLTIKYVNKYLF